MNEERKSGSANPYLNARREWDERYGDALSRAANWRLFAMASMAVAGVAVAGIVYIGSQSKIQPFVVAIDQMGSPVAIARPTSASASAFDEKVAIAQIANWLWNARSILADPEAQRVLIDRVYAMSSAEVAKQLNGYFEASSPFPSDGSTRKVTINSVLPVGQQTFEIAWTESMSRPGLTTAVERWKASITIGTDSALAAKPEVAIHNPLGIFVKNLSWAQSIGG